MVSFRCLFVLLLGLSVACGDDDIPVGDAGLGDAVVVQTGSLELLSATSLTLRQGESATIRVRYTDALGAQVPSQPLRFALDGTANDSTLASTEPLTDGVGVAETQIIAGAVAGTFRVRVSAIGSDGGSGAPPVYVNVAVSDRGFGHLLVTPIYAGARAGTLGVAIITSGTCADERARIERTRYRALVVDETVADFVGLPAGVPLAVVGRLDSASDALLAWSCADGVMVNPDESTEIEVTLNNLPFSAAGAYETHLGFRVDGLAEEATRRFGESLTPSAGDASRILDAIERQLEADEQAAALVALRRERVGGLDDAYSAILLAESVGLDVALSALIDELGAELAQVSLKAELRIGDGASMATQSVSVGAEPRPINLMRTGLTAPVDLRATVVAGGESLAVERLAVHLRGGALARAVVVRSSNEAGFENTGEWLHALARCESVPSPLADYCDDACVLSACAATVDEFLMEADRIFASLDVAWPELRLAGEVTLQDNSGDLTPDLVEGLLSGTWLGRAEAVEAAVDGERILPPS